MSVGQYGDWQMQGESAAPGAIAAARVRGKLTEGAPLAPLVWFKSGGAADWLFEPADVDDLRAEFELIRQLGYAECVEELERGMCSVAAPLHPIDLAPTLSIGATGPLRVFTPTFRTNMGQELTHMANNLTERLGMSAPDQTTESA